MVIEWLKFRVSPELREKFIQKDSEIWTATLSQYPGFLGKEIWINPEQSEVVMFIRWKTREHWKSVPQSVIDELDSKMGELHVPIAESREYQVRKFFH